MYKLIIINKYIGRNSGKVLGDIWKQTKIKTQNPKLFLLW